MHDDGDKAASRDALCGSDSKNLDSETACVQCSMTVEHSYTWSI